MTLSRRDLLRASASAGLAVGMSNPMRLAFASDPMAQRNLLVVLHLRGGCDGLNLISPSNDPDFVAARASDLRVLESGDNAGHALANGADPKIDFRLHKSADGLAELYKSGNLAFLHAAGLVAETRSHFVAIDMIERGVVDAPSLNRVTSGWLARHLGSQALPGVAAVSAGNAPSGEFLDLPSALAVADLAGGLGAPGGKPVEDVLERMYRPASGDVGRAGRATLDAMRVIDGKIARDPQGKVVVYAPSGGVNYDPAAELARPLKVVAQLAKLDVGLEVATVDLGGWDTHEGQVGRFRNLVDRLSRGLHAFYNDMAPYHDRLVVMVQTEFGRRLRSNRSGGTDHGRGTVMAVLGGKVAGGRMIGAWPGLSSASLEQGVDLRVATDYRQVVTEVLQTRTGGTSQPDLFPGFTPGPALGLFRA